MNIRHNRSSVATNKLSSSRFFRFQIISNKWLGRPHRPSPDQGKQTCIR